MKHPVKSKTILGLIAIFAASAPGLADPVWAVMEEAGASPETVAGIKVALYFIGLATAAYGRAVADGPLTLRGEDNGHY